MRRLPALCVCLALARALPCHASSTDSALVVVIDPGHGGSFPRDGAHGPNGAVEKDIALQVARRTKEHLEARGATVVLTREEDVDLPLAERVRMANEAGADVFLSIHCNSMATRKDRRVTRGVETYFLSPDPTDAEARMLARLENGGPEDIAAPRTSDAVSGILADLALGQARNDSAPLAQFVQKHLKRATRAPSRGVRQAPFLVLSGARMPAILVEIGFISHPVESRLLGREKYQHRIAEAITEGVREFADRVLSRRLVAQGNAPPAPRVGASGLSPVARPTPTR